MEAEELRVRLARLEREVERLRRLIEAQRDADRAAAEKSGQPG